MRVLWIKRSLAISALALRALGACSVEETMDQPACESGGSLIITAPSVPGDALVPYFAPLPAGWEGDTVTIDQDGTVVRLDSDRAGSGAAQLRYVESCSLGDAVAVPSDQDGADRYELIERVEPDFAAQRYYVFPGGCVWWDFDFREGASAALSIELGDALTLLTRTDLNDSLRETFIDEDL